jgi:hypothetical protein
MEYLLLGIVFVSLVCLSVGIAFGAVAAVMRLMTVLPAAKIPVLAQPVGGRQTLDEPAD